MEDTRYTSSQKENTYPTSHLDGSNRREFYEDKILSLGYKPLTPTLKKKFAGLVLLPNKCNLEYLKEKEESQIKNNETFNIPDNGNSDEDAPQSEKPSEKTTPPSQLECTFTRSEVTIQSFESSSVFSPVNSTCSLDKTYAKNPEKFALTGHDEEVLDWRIELEKFKEHIKNSTSGSSEEDDKIPTGNMETVEIKTAQPVKFCVTIARENTLQKDSFPMIKVGLESSEVENYIPKSGMINVKKVETISNPTKKIQRKKEPEFSQSEEPTKSRGTLENNSKKTFDSKRSKSKLMNVASATKNISRSFLISKKTRIGKEVRRQNGEDSVEEIQDLGTYEEFKNPLLRRAIRHSWELKKDVEDVDDYQNFKQGFLSKDGQIQKALNSTLMISDELVPNE